MHKWALQNTASLSMHTTHIVWYTVHLPCLHFILQTERNHKTRLINEREGYVKLSVARRKCVDKILFEFVSNLRIKQGFNIFNLIHSYISSSSHTNSMKFPPSLLLSLIRSYYPALLAGPLDCIEYPNRAHVESLLVCQLFRFYVAESIRQQCFWVRPNFFSSAEHTWYFKNDLWSSKITT